MRDLEQPFVIESQEGLISVAEHQLEDMRVFYLTFADTRKPLTITVAEGPRGERFWTSIPQGRQTEAEQFGKLIATFIRSKRKG